MRRASPHIIFIAILFILSLFFLNSILQKGSILNNVHYINDLAFLSYNTKEAIKNNELPLWTPYFYAGHPLLAIPENYMFDLNFLFVYLFGDIYLAMNLALIFYFFISGFGMYMLVYSMIGNSKAAFVSSIIYMFNGFVHSFIISGHINILEGYALIPLIVLCVCKALKSSEWAFYSLLGGMLFALQILSGSMILFFYTVLIVLLYMAVNLASKNFRGVLAKSIFIGALVAITAISLASIKLLPAAEFTKMSSRAAGVSFAEFLGEPVNFKDIVGVAVTNAGYSGVSAAAGIIGFMLMIYGLSEYKKKAVVFSVAAVVLSILLAAGTFVAGMMYNVPGFDKLRHVERALVVFAFAAPILSAYGFASLSERLKKYKVCLNRQNLFFGGVVFLILVELLFLQVVPSSAKIVVPNDIQLLDYISNDKSVFRTINLAQKEIVGAAGYNYYAQKGISEVKGGGGIWVNDYVMFLGIAQQALSSKILGILNVKYAVSDAKLEADGISFVKRFNECRECALGNAFGPYLYENTGFLPRYYIAPNSMLVAGNTAQAKQLIYSLMFQNWEPGNTVLIEGAKINEYSTESLKRFNTIFLLEGSVDSDSIGKLREYTASGGVIVPDILNGKSSISNEEMRQMLNKSGNYTEIKISDYSANKVVLDSGGKKGWLIASERFAHFPGWKASADGRNIEMFRADNVITATYLAGDEGNLVFEYTPKSYRKGKIISILAILAIISYAGYFIYKKFYVNNRLS